MSLVLKGDDRTINAVRKADALPRNEKNSLPGNSRPPSKGGGDTAYNGPFQVVKKNSTTVTIVGYDVSKEQFIPNNIYIGLDTIELLLDQDVQITDNGVVYADISYNGTVYIVAYLFASILPDQIVGHAYETLANIRFSDSKITSIVQIKRDEIHVAGRIV